MNIPAGTWRQRESDRKTLNHAVAGFMRAGYVGSATSLDELISAADAMQTMGDQRPIPGWLAALHLAERYAKGTTMPDVGDVVRVTYPDRTTVAGVWSWDEPTKRPYVLRDDNGEPEWRVQPAAAAVEVLRLGTKPSAARLDGAATALRTAWQWMGLGAWRLDLEEEDDLRLNGCFGCAKLDTAVVAPAGLECDHSAGCECRPCVAREYERPRWCACGEDSRYRAVAWAPVPQYAAEVGLESAEIDGETLELSAPGEYAAANVCSAVCARLWMRTVGPRLAEQVPERESAAIRYRMEPWSYTPGRHDVPRWLHDARTLAHTASTHLDHAARQWSRGRVESTAHELNYARGAVSAVVDDLVAIGIPDDHTLWPVAPFDLGEGELDGLAADLLAAVQCDRSRYQVGDRVVFDRVEQKFVCRTCPDVPIFQLDAKWRGLLKPLGNHDTGQVLQLGFKKTCPRCSTPLLP